MPQKSKQYKTNHHHIRRLHKARVVWFIVLALGLAGLQAASLTSQAAQGKILAYATNVSIGGLAASTNQARVANGLGQLALNSALNSGAQAKAQHMITHNYWSHTAPDGTEPWFFFNWAGYDYQHAGENLAYGFDSSGEIIDAWMNSSGHRANILGNYEDMGFGFANGDGYQGGQYTVVVAFYGTKQAPPPPPPPPAPVVKATPTPTPTPEAEPEPEPEPTPTPEVPAETPAATTPEPEPATTEESAAPAEPKRVTNLQNIFSGNAGWAMYASLGLVAASTVGFVTTHIELVRRGWRRSAHFIFVHPALDTAILVALIAALLTSTVGFIR